jgi:hypothetical protein
MGKAEKTRRAQAVLEGLARQRQRGFVLRNVSQAHFAAFANRFNRRLDLRHLNERMLLAAAPPRNASVRSCEARRSPVGRVAQFAEQAVRSIV